MRSKTKKNINKRRVVLMNVLHHSLPQIKISFPFNVEDLSRVKSLPQRKYNLDKKYWTCPFTEASIDKLTEWGFDSADDLKLLFNSKATSVKIKYIKIPGLQMKLYKYQKAGVSFIDKLNGRVLLGDEMGLGKTPQALAWCQLHEKRIPIVIVCPASLKLNWKKEAYAWMKAPRVQILNGRNPSALRGEILIINYDVLPAWVNAIKRLNPPIVIGDEIHMIKNNKALRTKAFKSLCKGVPHVLLLSGTPIENRPIEIYNPVNIIDPTLFSNYWEFVTRYCDAKRNGFGWNLKGASNIKELHKILTDSIMIRRLKKDVLPDLPDKQYSFVDMEIDNRKEYQLAESDFLQYIGNKFDADEAEIESKLKDELQSMLSKYDIEGIDFGDHVLDKKKTEIAKKEKIEKVGNAQMLVQMEHLKQLAVEGKMKQCVDWISNFLLSGEKLVVFAVHKFVIDRLMEEFGTAAVKIDGSTAQNKRQKNVDQFQTNPAIKLFVGNIKAAGVGLTLTAASNVVFLEYPWTPGALMQAADRCHRITQKFTVTIYYLMALNTIESKIAKLLDKKAKVVNQVLDGVEPTTETSILNELIINF